MEKVSVLKKQVYPNKSTSASRGKLLKKRIKRGIPLYLMMLPGVLFFLLFKYLPMFGLSVAFMEYDPFSGFFGSEWVWFAHFERLFQERIFLDLLWNTFVLSIYDLVFYFPAPIILALLLNEVRIKWFRTSIQTILYTPHFISWVVIVGITAMLFSTQSGVINNLLHAFGLSRIEVMTDASFFRPLWVIHNIWNGMGWDAIIYLAAMASINPQLYEAARIDGATRLQLMRLITIPSISYLIVVMFILRLGGFLDLSFTHVYLLQNPLNLGVSDIFDTYVYRAGVLGGQYSYTTAVGLFKSVVGLILVIGANKLAKKMGKEGVY
ncbi:ABC transporter permease subunit [Gracilibacillus sp. S3-1-1]|uniref:ABC transporter permease subunit n=1 Tax=Gracilibacillus pellucidus TaxID=3095368 RepID=A0ACC6M303_9BACI|nr:ABC transporter permease subunit [Gracilibacillus sp. S3-1-1]MDX8045326.1 ABC transporter permease subunit [Gracilibacillus sp. S3-1-1]